MPLLLNIYLDNVSKNNFVPMELGTHSSFNSVVKQNKSNLMPVGIISTELFGHNNCTRGGLHVELEYSDFDL